MDALLALKTRRSVRRYLPQPVAPELLSEAVDCARLAASARNLQPWEFIVVTEKNDLEQLASLTDYGRHIAHAGACIAVFCRDGKYYLEDGAAATQNLLVAAHALGLGACWIAGDKKQYGAEVAHLLSLPEGFRLVSLVAVGYPDETPTREKRPLTEVLHWGRYRG